MFRDLHKYSNNHSIFSCLSKWNHLEGCSEFKIIKKSPKRGFCFICGCGYRVRLGGHVRLHLLGGVGVLCSLLAFQRVP